MDRVSKSRAELEALCVDALRLKPGMHGLRAVRITRYSGQEGWTWEVADFQGEVKLVAFQDAIEVVRKLQQMYDLA